MKRIVFAFLAVVFVITGLSFPVSANSWLWDGSIATDFSSGSGTEADPFIISNGAELAYLAQSVNDGNGYEGVYFALGADIYLNDISNPDWQSAAREWTPIGTYTDEENSKPFKGNFNGLWYEIHGLYINTQEHNQGLFGYILGATVKNVIIKNSYIKGGDNVGAVVGLANPYLDLGMSKSEFNDLMEQCMMQEVHDKVDAVKTELSVFVNNCVSYADVEGKSNVGGIVGFTRQEMILDMYGGEEVFASATGDVNNCVNYGKIKGVESVGGIAGTCVTVDNSENYGNIEGEESVGGISGCVHGWGGTENCINHGSVSGVENVGGIIGYALAYIYGQEVNYCVNYGAVDGKELVGGIAGYGMADIRYSANYGSVHGESCVGGIYGSFYFDCAGPSVVDSYNAGAVSGAENVGGICGHCDGLVIRQVYNIGTVESNGTVGEICGIAYWADNMENVYYIDHDLDEVGEWGDESNYDLSGLHDRSETEMQEEENFQGFDFETVWKMSESEDYPYPVFLNAESSDAELPEENLAGIPETNIGNAKDENQTQGTGKVPSSNNPSGENTDNGNTSQDAQNLAKPNHSNSFEMARHEYAQLIQSNPEKKIDFAVEGETVVIAMEIGHFVLIIIVLLIFLVTLAVALIRTKINFKRYKKSIESQMEEI